MTWASGRDAIDAWFAGKGWTPWEFQREAWDAYARGESGLVQVATGAGKTFAAYMGALAEMIDELARGEIELVRAKVRRRAKVASDPASAAAPIEAAVPSAPVPATLRMVYVTPLRAVSRDIELALKQPIADLSLPLRVESRTGDTAASVRARQRESLPHVLITTPESLTLLLTRENAREHFSKLACVVVDEWHELIASKRGTQVELALARLRTFSPRVRTWALSATLPNLEAAGQAAVGTGAKATIVRGDMPRPVQIDSILPSEGRRLPWAGHLGLTMLPDVVAALDPRVVTLIFTNTRSQSERWYHAMLVMKPDWAGVAALHHGSIDRAERERVEAGLKDGSLRLVVATSSLDLGVDFTPVERVFQIGSPKGVARLVQRAGRSSHQPKAPCRITCVPTHMLELVEIAAVKRALAQGRIEERIAFEKPLDVLVQHMVTCALGGGFDEEALFHEVRTAWSYRDLTRQEFGWCLALVKHGGETLSAYPEFHRVAEVEGRYRVSNSRLAQLHRLNVGTITGDTTIEIRFVRGRSLGRIEEGFISGLEEGQQFVFAGQTVKFVGMRDLVAYVRPARGNTTFTPIWSGTKLPISESLAQGIRETLEAASDGQVEGPEIERAMELIRIQRRESAIPRADETLVELTRTNEGFHVFMYPFDGRLVHAGLATVLALRLARLKAATFSMAVSDYGFELLSSVDYPFEEMLTADVFTRENLTHDILASMNMSIITRLQFREVARVAGLVFQNYPGAFKSARQFQASSGLLYDVLVEFDPENLLLHQARREVLDRHFEQSRFARTLDRVRGSSLRIVRTRRPTPLSLPLIVERNAGKLSTQSIMERIEQVQRSWESWESPSRSEAGARGREEPSPPAPTNSQQRQDPARRAGAPGAEPPKIRTRRSRRPSR